MSLLVASDSSLLEAAEELLVGAEELLVGELDDAELLVEELDDAELLVEELLDDVLGAVLVDVFDEVVVLEDESVDVPVVETSGSADSLHAAPRVAQRVKDNQ